MSLENNITVIGKLMRSWPGTPVDSYGTVRALNASGTKPPLFWVFNNAAEPQRLSDALGDDQPLICARSLHMVVPPDWRLQEARAELGNYYAQVLETSLHSGRIWFGASCQGAMVSMHAAAYMIASGHNVMGIGLISSRSTIPIAIRALLMYGENDPNHDPFRSDRTSAESEAQANFSDYRRLILADMGHGEYFSPGNVERVVDHLEQFRDSITHTLSGPSAPASSTIVGL